MLDLQAMKDTLIAIERETYNITAIIVRLLPEQNTLIELQAIKTSLLAIEDKTDILATIINTLLQESTLIGRLQSISRDVQAMLTQMEWRDTSAQHSATQSHPTVQQSYEPGQATLKRRRIEYDHQHQPIAKTNMQHPTLQNQPTMTMQQLYERRQVALEHHRLEHERQLQRSESHTVKTDYQGEDEIDHSC